MRLERHVPLIKVALEERDFRRPLLALLLLLRVVVVVVPVVQVAALEVLVALVAVALAQVETRQGPPDFRILVAGAVAVAVHLEMEDQVETVAQAS